MMKIPSKIFFLNSLDSKPTLQGPNLGQQQDCAWKNSAGETTPQDKICLRTLAGPALRHRSSAWDILLGKPGMFILSLCQEITNMHSRS